MLCRGDIVKALITCRSLLEGRQTQRVAVSGLVDLLAMCYLFAVVITISLSLLSAPPSFIALRLYWPDSLLGPWFHHPG